MSGATCPVVARGKHYPSIREAAKHLGVSDRWARKCLQIKGHLEDAGRGKIGNKDQKRRAITICGRTFESITEAARYLGISRHTVARSIKPDAPKESRESLMRAMMLATARRDALATARREAEL